MAHRICPWWIGYLLASPVRLWLGQDPVKIVSPYVREGMTVLEPGPGLGFFTVPLARLVGSSGRVIALDMQPKMIEGLKRRAAKASVLGQIDARVTSADTMGISDLQGKVDFVLAFAMVHEFPDAAKFFAEAARALKPGGTLLLAEPRGHVCDKAFDRELAAAAAVGLASSARPVISRSHAALLRRN
jgi:ubiquinone/menaquinone biosynthesis C-methylase UbiE